MGRPGSVGPMAGQVRAGGAGEQPCVMAGAGAGGSRGLTWGPGLWDPWWAWGQASSVRSVVPAGPQHFV